MWSVVVQYHVPSPYVMPTPWFPPPTLLLSLNPTSSQLPWTVQRTMMQQAATIQITENERFPDVSNEIEVPILVIWLQEKLPLSFLIQPSSHFTRHETYCASQLLTPKWPWMTSISHPKQDIACHHNSCAISELWPSVYIPLEQEQESWSIDKVLDCQRVLQQSQSLHIERLSMRSANSVSC